MAVHRNLPKSFCNILDNANGMNKNAHICHCSTNTIINITKPISSTDVVHNHAKATVLKGNCTH